MEVLNVVALPPHHFTQHIYSETSFIVGSQDSIVGIATGYGLDNRGVRV
jgi:hypothetical protein